MAKNDYALLAFVKQKNDCCDIRITPKASVNKVGIALLS
tara:strand:+ start:430373 stop:430489 length:117 start_codon:yes stop_codon:yes gene_type:complete